MEFNTPITRLEVLKVTANSAHIRITTINGDEYEVNLAEGGLVEVAIPEGQETDPYSLLEDYLVEMPSDLLPDAPEENAETVNQPAALCNRVFEELQNLDPQFRNPLCPQCGRAERLIITHEGIVTVCRECGQPRRAKADILQRLADELGILCFSCTIGKLKSEATEYANILVCQNPACGSHNSWRGVSDRIQS